MTTQVWELLLQQVFQYLLVSLGPYQAVVKVVAGKVPFCNGHQRPGRKEGRNGGCVCIIAGVKHRKPRPLCPVMDNCD